MEENKKNEQKTKLDLRRYVAAGITAIVVILIALLLFFGLSKLQGLEKGANKISSGLQPVFFGLIMAYILNPIMKFFEKLQYKRAAKKNKEINLKLKNRIRTSSVALALVVFLVIIAAIILMILPELITSVEELVKTTGDKLNSAYEWIEKIINKNEYLQSTAEKLTKDAIVNIQDWLKTKVLDPNGLLVSVSSGVYAAFKTALNFVIGIIISVYVLMKKEVFIGQAKKIIFAIFKPRYGNIIMEVVQKADDVFGGFFIGKIIDSIIIGFICLGCLTVVSCPYATIISTIVGVTNVIPFFGPYFGAIPCAVLLFLTEPIYALYFLIFIFVLQQVDGNIIGPKILGDTTGLSPFWIIFSVMFFGAAFGVAGMLFGVPIFALIYYIIKRLIEHFLRKRKLPEKTLDYAFMQSVDENNNLVRASKKHSAVRNSTLFKKLSVKINNSENPDTKEDK